MRTTTARLFLLVLLIVGEAMAISVAFDAQTLPQQHAAGNYWWLAHAGAASKILFIWVVALLVALGPRLKQWSRQLQVAADGHRYHLWLSLQLSAYLLFFALTYLVFSTTTNRWDGRGIPLPLFWLAALAFVVVLWLNTIAPIRFWFRFVREEVITIGFASVIATLTWGFTLVTQGLWDPLSGATFDAATSVLHLFYADIVVDPQQRILGVGDFVVEIAAVCSGYEGIGLVLIFTGFYLIIFRQDFRFPQALLLLPLGVATIWLFNIFRIAALIGIGAEISPELALGGFHSMAGWISFVLVTACILLLAHNSALFSRSPQRLSAQPINFRMALLIPLVVLLSTTLITSAMTITVDWWYPLRVVLTACALALLWRHYRHIPFRITWFAVATGVLVFLLWLLLVPDDPVASTITDQYLHEIPSGLLFAWLLFRTLGAVITVPLAEELAFRGYLFELLGTDRQSSRRSQYPWLALIVSSVLFGLLHSAWLAGLLAGVAYGLVRCYRNNVADAFVAHAITNGLLSVYVVTTGSWSLW
ncbi:exosortase E/protease, VPEID-CTERM system [Hydrogenophaga sp.]|uniref:exosortase E/protease, VPEID-CTERM system n=1 Tax=Hydrogenophaga sp. TaxID=1904254 RepID=UPI0025BB8764|nr:exosortase E/protease, VPEID-CTERM system [Hydrogenophaga sp.]